LISEQPALVDIGDTPELILGRSSVKNEQIVPGF
jgi:hypothetical protein